MDITLKIENLDLSGRVLSYAVTHEITYRKVITTLDETEHPYQGAKRPIVTFSLMPGTEQQDTELYSVLENLIFYVTYLHNGAEINRKMRLVSNLESTFLLTSVDGKRRYKQGEIQLRGL